MGPRVIQFNQENLRKGALYVYQRYAGGVLGTYIDAVVNPTFTLGVFESIRPEGNLERTRYDNVSEGSFAVQVSEDGILEILTLDLDTPTASRLRDLSALIDSHS